MRELRLRVWDKETSKMLLPNTPWLVPYEKGMQIANPEVLISLRGNPVVTVTTFGNTEIMYAKMEKKDLVIMQYLGLKDKNNKEIYEGDIIQSSDANKTIFKIFLWCWGIGAQEKNGKVHCFNVPPYDENLTFDTVPNWTIIGNEYESPELLK